MIGGMNWFGISLIVGLIGFAATRVEAGQPLPEAVSSHIRIAPLLEKRVVRLHSEGQADLAFQVALDIVRDEDFLSALQEAYALMLPEGQSPEFTVRQTIPGQYAYVNRDGEQTQVTEIQRAFRPGCVDLYLYTEGDRFFGRFEALTAITVRPAGTDRVDWQVTVYAYPRNVLSRLVARTGVVNRFFRSKTDEITELAVQIGTFMTNRQKTGAYPCAVATPPTRGLPPLAQVRWAAD